MKRPQVHLRIAFPYDSFKRDVFTLKVDIVSIENIIISWIASLHCTQVTLIFYAMMLASEKYHCYMIFKLHELGHIYPYTHVSCYEINSTLQFFGAIFTKGNNFGDLLFASLPNWGLHLKKRIGSRGSKFFSFKS